MSLRRGTSIVSPLSSGGEATAIRGGGSVAGRQAREASEGGRCPPSRSASADRERHVQGHRAPLEQHREPVAVLGVACDPLVVTRGTDLLAIDLPDHVAALNAGLGGGTAFVHAGDDD